MANRQALRELQTRLADRLQAARTNTSLGASWLAVQVGGRNYLLPLEQAGEIFSWSGVLRVPYTSSWFWGVANLRGSLAGVVDLCAYLGHPIERTEQSLHEVSLLTINPALQVNVALVVDRLMGLRSADDFILTAVEAAQEPEQAQPGMVGASSYTDSAGSVWQVLQLHQLVQSPEFLSIRL
ncbi:MULTISPECIES: chemotaxis protein CheW [unclassified Comamonas]|mgnify:CR=1 FL=1|uniref:chemotaxis protein CheW n=1 Tax=unclassified Comamonas TaxID=2638500 RepID=UPI00177E76D4|nr:MULTISPECIES: chemotaxis protein CheW [unclassified Comamonas]MBD9400770.1 chemotaxis protein CheW [Comamonas sp. CMM02]